MKKFFLLLIIIIGVGTVAIYYLIPGNIIVSKSTNINANPEGVFRYLRTDSNWQKWWPGKTNTTQHSKTILELENYRFSLKTVLYNAFEFNIETGKVVIDGSLFLIPIQTDSFRLQWTATSNSGKDPVTKMQRYLTMKNLEKSFENILTKMADHFNTTINIYGLDIKNEKVQIQHLIASKNLFNHYPKTLEVYAMINQLRKYLAEFDAKEEGPPMLNVSTKDSIHFETQVAIPVNKYLSGNNLFTSKMMLKGGNILVSDVSGDINAINQGFKKMEIYISDYHRAIIAIPFQMLLNDRMKEPDSTKWLTRLYYPVM